MATRSDGLKATTASVTVAWLLLIVILIFGSAELAVLHSEYPPTDCAGTSETDYTARQQSECISFTKKTIHDPVAIFTLLLVVVACLQAVLFFWQLNLIRDGSDAALRAANTAERSLLDLERPHLFIEVGEGIKVHEFENGALMPFVTITATNHGRFPADITQAKAGVFRSGPQADGNIFDRPQLVQVVGAGRPLEGIEMQVSEKLDLIWGAMDDEGRTTDAYPRRIPTGLDTFVRIELRYEGVKDTSYVTDFTWLWDHGPNRWVLYTKHRT